MSEAFKGRREDRRLVTGQGRYSADWNLPGQAYGVFVRSDRAHADIVSIDTGAARAHPGVLAVLTSADTRAAGLRTPPTMVSYPGRGGSALINPFRHILAHERVRYVGEEVALVVAASLAQAQDAAEKILVEYRDRPALVEVEDALAAGAACLHEEIPGNLCFDFEYGDEATVEAAFERAHHVTRLALDSQRVAGSPMEPKACLATYDPAREVYDLWSPSQGMTMLRGGLAGITGLGPNQLRVHAHDVGGGFGIRSAAYPEYVAVMLAARLTGRPVKWVGTRSESFVSDHHGRAIRLGGALALDRDGRFLALRHDWTCNQGAYLSGAGPLINTITPKLTPTGVYAIPAVYGRNRLVMTNTTPITAYRGAGRPDTAYIIERLVDQAALETGIDRLELRRRNFIARSAFPYKTPVQVAYDSGDYGALLERARDKADWQGFEQRRAEAARRGCLRGIGCAVFVEPAGGGGAPKDQTMLKFGSSGQITLFSVAGPSGQGHETVFPEIVARALGIPPEKVVLRTSDPDGPPLIGSGTVGSRSMSAHGSASLLAARAVIDKGLALAAQELEVAPQDLEFSEGHYRVKGTDRAVDILELARRHAPVNGVHPLDAGGEVPVSNTFPSGAHIAELEVDPATGLTEIIRYTAVDDCGVVLNHTLLDGQLHGGIVQGAGQVFGEQCVYERSSGQLLSGSFMDYPMPRAGLLGALQLEDLPVPSPNNPLGVKGAGESGTTGALATLMNALADALRPAGVTHFDMPATPARVWQALVSRARAS